MPRSENAEQHFVFINQCGPPAKSAEKRHRVYVHVQKERYKHQARTLKRALSTSRSDGEQACLSSTTSRYVVHPESLCGNKSTDGLEASHDQHEPLVNPVQSTIDTTASMSLQTILKRGQSDPFNSYAISIDPITNRLITYYKHHILFTRHQVNAKTWSLNRSAVADWQDSIGQLTDEGLGHAFLAQVSSLVAAETSHAGVLQSSIAYNHRSTAILRGRLERNRADLDSCRTFRHILLLQSVEITMHNPVAANTHGQMLRRLFDRKIHRGESMHMRSLLYALQIDVLMAISFWVRPHFYPIEVLPEPFEDLISTVFREVPRLGSVSVEHLDPQIEGSRLHRIFLQWKQSSAIRAAAISRGFAESQVLYDGRRLWTFVSQLEALHHVEDVEDDILVQGNPSELSSLHTQAYITLAALFLIRSSTAPENLKAKTMFEAHQNIFKKLRHHLDVGEFLDTEHHYSRARLWALFVGAQSERQAAVLYKRSPGSASRGWFNVRFARHATQLGLVTWSSVRGILEEFMYCEMAPHPSEWYNVLSCGESEM